MKTMMKWINTGHNGGNLRPRFRRNGAPLSAFTGTPGATRLSIGASRQGTSA